MIEDEFQATDSSEISSQCHIKNSPLEFSPQAQGVSDDLYPLSRGLRAALATSLLTGQSKVCGNPHPSLTHPHPPMLCVVLDVLYSTR